MDHVSHADLRQHLAEVMDIACESRAPVLVTRQNTGSVVLLSLEEFRTMEETLPLPRSPRNTDRLLRSVAGHEIADLPAPP